MESLKKIWRNGKLVCIFAPPKLKSGRKVGEQKQQGTLKYIRKRAR